MTTTINGIEYEIEIGEYDITLMSHSQDVYFNNGARELRRLAEANARDRGDYERAFDEDGDYARYDKEGISGWMEANAPDWIKENFKGGIVTVNQE